MKIKSFRHLLKISLTKQFSAGAGLEKLGSKLQKNGNSSEKKTQVFFQYN